MLPLSIQNRFKNPGKVEREFLDFLQAAKLPIDNNKTIASEVLEDARVIANKTNDTFFSGAFVSVNTNIQGGSYVRPQSEHFVIYGIRIYTANSATVSGSSWERGLIQSIDSVLYNSHITIVNNSVVELKNMPLSEFDGTLTTKDQGTLYLDEPILWAGQTELKTTLANNSGGQYPANQAFKIALVGIGLI